MLRTAVPAWQFAETEVVPVLVAIYEGTGKDVVDYARQPLPSQVTMPWIVTVWKIFEFYRRFEAMKGRGFVLGLDGSREVIIDTEKRAESE